MGNAPVGLAASVSLISGKARTGPGLFRRDVRLRYKDHPPSTVNTVPVQ